MNINVIKFGEYMLRGYAQMFLGSNIVSGAMILAGLLIASPQNGLWSLAGAVTITAVALLFKGAPHLVRSGLFGVNGVLLGCSWALFPEVPTWFKAAATLGGAMVIAAGLAPATRWLIQRKSRFCLFSLPAVLAVWLLLFTTCRLGFYDVHLFTGWQALYHGNITEAERQFTAVRVTTDKAGSFREDGLGWARFFQLDYVQAAAHFERATVLSPGFADAFDGLGWCAFRQGLFSSAKKSFTKSVDLDPRLADSWDGLGWIAFNEARPAESQRFFARAVFAAPLFVDAWDGLARSAQAAGSTAVTQVARSMSHMTVSRAWQFTSSPQLLAWTLFLAAIAVHSRISGVAALIALGGLLLTGQMASQVRGELGDVNFLGNYIAITVALCGQYLRLNPAGIGFCAGAGLLLALAWPTLAAHSMTSGLPLLWLPCNVILLTSLTLRRNSVPLDLAATNAETVRLWWQKKETAEEGWKMLASAGQGASR